MHLWRPIGLALFDGLQQQGLEPNVITYSAVISACERGDSSEGLAALRSDAAAGTQALLQFAKVITYALVILAGSRTASRQ